jgi:hypothetical protein
MSGKLLIEWRHDLCAEITKKRYINEQEMMRLAHAEIVNLFFPQETSDESDEINSETSDKSSEFPSVAWHHVTILCLSKKIQCETCKNVQLQLCSLSQVDIYILLMKLRV